jgi:hypothetical protein
VYSLLLLRCGCRCALLLHEACQPPRRLIPDLLRSLERTTEPRRAVARLGSWRPLRRRRDRRPRLLQLLLLRRGRRMLLLLLLASGWHRLGRRRCRRRRLLGLLLRRLLLLLLLVRLQVWVQCKP